MSPDGFGAFPARPSDGIACGALASDHRQGSWPGLLIDVAFFLFDISLQPPSPHVTRCFEQKLRRNLWKVRP